MENGAVRAEFSISYYRGLRRYRLRFSHRAEHSRMAVVLVLIGGMLALELLNTAIEHVVDLVTDQYHPLAKAAKDAAAGAVCVFAVISCIIGLLIFLPKIC